MSISETKEITRNVEGWLFSEERVWLYRAAKRVKKGVIVEIGSWKGLSTIWLAKGSQAGYRAKVYAIDPHTGAEEHKQAGKVWTYDIFLENIKKAEIEDIVIPIVKTSEEANKNGNIPIGLLFIDGAHDYELVKLDFELWYPYLINGGIIAFHDSAPWSGWKGPIKVVQEEIYNSNKFVDIGEIKSITFAKKKQKRDVTSTQSKVTSHRISSKMP